MRKLALPPLIDPSSRSLILGTMPGERSIALQQYYGNRGNQFWKILFAVFNRPFSNDYSERVRLLKDHRIALWNVLASCERTGSGDQAIRHAVPNDFGALFAAHPLIRHVFFESKTAHAWYGRYASFQPHISYHVLPSTSGLYAGMSLAEKTLRWQLLADIAR